MEQLRILRGIRRHAVHMVHPLIEIGAGQAAQLVNQLFSLPVRHGPGEKKAVDQHPEL